MSLKSIRALGTNLHGLSRGRLLRLLSVLIAAGVLVSCAEPSVEATPEVQAQAIRELRANPALEMLPDDAVVLDEQIDELCTGDSPLGASVTRVVRAPDGSDLVAEVAAGLSRIGGWQLNPNLPDTADQMSRYKAQRGELDDGQAVSVERTASGHFEVTVSSRFDRVTC